jgi:hypothetical protein
MLARAEDSVPNTVVISGSSPNVTKKLLAFQV